MQLKDASTEFATILTRACNGSVINDAFHDLEIISTLLKRELETGTTDADTIATIRMRIATLGLRTQQKDIPRLSEVAALCFDVAGAAGIRDAIAPILRLGTNMKGEPMPPVLSDYVAPEVFADGKK